MPIDTRRTPGESERPRRGMDEIVAALHEDAAREEGGCAASALKGLLTLGGKLPLRMALSSLTPWERSIFAYLQKRPGIRLGRDDPPNSPDTLLIIQDSRIGRVSFVSAEEGAASSALDEGLLAGFITIPRADAGVLEKRLRGYEQKWDLQVSEVRQTLVRMEQSGRLRAVVTGLAEILRHLAPIIIYVQRRMYSSFDRAGKNLLDGRAEKRLLSRLAELRLDEWCSEDQVFVYGADLLLVSGGPYRLEEFNSAQLLPSTLDRFFDNKIKAYANLIGRSLEPGWGSQPLLRKAQAVASLRDDVSRQFHRFRRIHGLNLRKEEHILGPVSADLQPAAALRVVDRAARIFHVRRIDGESRTEYWRRIVRELLTVPQNGNDVAGNSTKAFELLLWLFIRSVADETGSDIAMMSFVRDPGLFREPGGWSRVGKQDLFCCVAPSRRLLETTGVDEISTWLRSIALRMEFNRWHFIPGNFAASQIAADRDWFFPPQLPDIATWTDQHHGGHIAARVHYSIRYPAPLLLHGVTYNAAYDIRLMRQSGRPFRKADLWTCRSHVHDLGIILGTWIELEETKPAGIRISTFTSEWYRRGEWMTWTGDRT